MAPTASFHATGPPLTTLGGPPAPAAEPFGKIFFGPARGRDAGDSPLREMSGFSTERLPPGWNGLRKPARPRCARQTAGQACRAGQQHRGQEDQVDDSGGRSPSEPVRVARERDELQHGKHDVSDGGRPQAARVSLQQRLHSRHAQAHQPGPCRLIDQRGQSPRPQRRDLSGHGEQRHAEAEQDGRLPGQHGVHPGRQADRGGSTPGVRACTTRTISISTGTST
jgi:hypothetical protein